MVPGCRLVVLGLGRYGGRALTHASDLDLVYLFTGDHAAESTGPKPLSATVWFQRVSARLTAALSVPTAAGALYEVDTRLRPSGAKGLLAVTVASFARYQADEAETWEHMALCRARVVASDPADRVAIEAVVATILDRPRDPVMLRRDVLAMRRDIAAAKPGGGVWDVKLASGGLVDLEFIVHFLQLRDRVAMTPDLRAALVALAAAGTVPDGMIAAHDTLTRILALLRLVVAGPLPKRFPNAVEALLASATGATDFAGAETATGLAKAAVRAAWSEIFALGD
jgi:glutamate-ammonia-ligase adenylyltransferase